MSLIAMSSMVLLFIYYKNKFKKYSCKHINFLKVIKLMYSELKSVILNSFKKKNINGEEFKDKLYKLILWLLEKPLVLFLFLSMSIFLIALYLPSVWKLRESIKNLFTGITLVSFIIFVIIFTTINLQINKTIAILRMFYLYMASPVMAIGGIYILVFLNGRLEIGIFSVVLSITFFVMYALFTLYICHRDIKSKFFRLALSLPLYIAILSFSAFIFGAYYYSVFDDLPIIKAKDILTIISTYAKFGFKIFYSFNDTGHYTRVTLCQYYFGKILDIFILGFIFNKITEQKLTEKQVIEKKSLTYKELKQGDFNKRASVIKKIRDLNNRKLKK